MPSRRHVLALAATALSAGCLGQTDPPPGCQQGAGIIAEPYDPATATPIDLDETQRSIVRDAVANGTASYTTYLEPPLESGLYVTHEGTYYRTEYEVATSQAVPAFEMSIGWEEGQTAPDDEPVIAFEDLPASDRTAVRFVATPEGSVDQDGDPLPSESLDVNTAPVPYPDGGDASELVGATTWVRWHARTLRISVASESTTTQERRTFRYSLESVAESASGFREHVAPTYRLDLDGLSDAQRSILESAREGGYEACQPYSEAERDLLARLRDAEQIPDRTGESWYVAVDDERFELSVREWER